MMKHTWKYIALLLLGGMVFSQCQKDDVILEEGWTDYDRELEIAAPLINGEFAAIDLLEVLDSTSFIYTDAEGLLHLKYEDTLSSNYDEVIAIEDVTYTKSYDLAAPMLKSTKVLTGVITDKIRLNEMPDQRFDSITIASADMDIQLVPPVGSFTGTYIMKFPQIVRNGIAYEVTGDFSGTQNFSADLSGYTIYPLQAVDSSYFEIQIEVHDLAPVGIPTATELSVDLVIADLMPGNVFGYFGQSEVLNEIRDFDFDFLNSMDLTDMIQLKGIELIFKVQNYFGIEFSTTLNSIVGRNTNSGNEVTLDLTTNNNIIIEPALFANPVVPMENEIIIDGSNSNIDELINAFPNQLSFGVVVDINPSGSVNQNFISSIYQLDGIFSLDVPFWFKASNYTRVDTMGFDIEAMVDSSTVDAITDFSINYTFVNGFPFDFGAQGYFVDENFVVVDSLFNDGSELLWEGGAINAEGRVTAPGETNGTITLSSDKVKRLNAGKVKHILLSSSIATSDNGSSFVKLYEDYKMSMKLGVKVKTGDIPTN